jgi:Holliday junction DNA helicase RuvA
MIHHLHGLLIEKRPPTLVLDVNGVGYELDAPMSTFYELPATGEKIELLTHLLVREDAHQLYGFARAAERDLFRILIRISGVGAKVALSILSGIDAATLSDCVERGDTAPLVRIPGIGKKTAERLLVELQGRLPSGLPSSGGAVSLPPAEGGRGGGLRGNEPLSALIALGYKPAEADRLLASIDTEGCSTEEIIRLALKAAVRS